MVSPVHCQIGTLLTPLSPVNPSLSPSGCCFQRLKAIGQRLLCHGYTPLCQLANVSCSDLSLGTPGAKTPSRKAPGFSSSPSSPSFFELLRCFAVLLTFSLQLRGTSPPRPLRSGYTTIVPKSTLCMAASTSLLGCFGPGVADRAFHCSSSLSIWSLCILVASASTVFRGDSAVYPTTLIAFPCEESRMRSVPIAVFAHLQQARAQPAHSPCQPDRVWWGSRSSCNCCY